MSENKYKDHPVYQRINRPGPKRILALDGGGIRGALTIGYLEKIEDLLRKRYGKEELVLSEYFDLIGGTSTGSIIASLLALGRSVEEIRELYFQLGAKIFKKRNHFLNLGIFKYLISSEFDHRPLWHELENRLNTITLGGKELKTGLAIFTKRADTFSTWTFHNNPLGAYYEENSGIYLKELVRASTAAPSFFKPKNIEFHDGESAVFIDGGVSMANNPSLMLFLMATISGYQYNWKKGEDHLFIVSVGTGTGVSKIQGKEKDELVDRASYTWAKDLSDLFMTDATRQNQLLLQYMSNPMTPQRIDSEAGDLSGDLLTKKPLLSYCRYNISIDQKTLAKLDIDKTHREIDSLRQMQNGENARTLYAIGSADAANTVSKKHFKKSFDLYNKED